jgi:methionyl aminopeptidase
MIINLFGSDWLEKQRVAGQAVTDCLHASRDMLKSGVTGKQVEAKCLEIIAKYDCTPTFLNYQPANHAPFPGAICFSINKELVHGIPNDTPVAEGDVVKVDLGATYQGAIADAAITVIIGQGTKEQQEGLKTCREALEAGIKAIKVDAHLGVIGSAIYRATRYSKFGLITNYGGHGLDWNRPHAPPFVANKDESKNGVRLQAGMTLAIEPMLTTGAPVTRLSADGWAVTTPGLGFHFERTIYLGQEGVEIITPWS